ncbi:polysaccharide biosynthesis protein [Polynucleobacter paneuropaeus]|nr:polysaccharide biosynthesis protein [Polynucleobacter paneuropaeus]
MVIHQITTLILGLPRVLKRSIVMAVDITLCFISVYLAFYLRVGIWVPIWISSSWRPLLVLGASIGIGLPVFIFCGLYREVFRHSGWPAILASVKATLIYAIIFISIFTFIGIEGVPRTIGFIQPIVLLLLIVTSRILAGYLLRNPYRKELRLAKVPRVLIYGAGNAGRQLAAALSHSYEMQVIGFIDDNPQLQGSVMAGKKIYNPKFLSDLVISLQVSSVLLAIPSASRHRRNQILQLVQQSRVGVQTLPGMSELAQGKISTQDLRSLDIDDLLGRDPVMPDPVLLGKNITNKVVLVTGAGGSIGGELCRQIIERRPKTLVLLEQSEFALYQIHQELSHRLEGALESDQSAIDLVPILASVTNSSRIQLILEEVKPDTIYHAAAYKHVPLVEANPTEGIKNNAFGTLVIAKIAMQLGVPNFILISTDKAVRPTNVMGASKRLAEMVLQALAAISTKTCFAMVRFGNVLDSSGSVVPKFRQQIKDGGPVTVTDFEMTRFFMTIPEAAQLVIQAGAMAKGGEVFLLDMGQPVKILDLARRMVELSGLEIKDESNPNGDIEITEIGLRPGEKLYEELLISGNPDKTDHPLIFKAQEAFIPWDQFEQKLTLLQTSLDCNDQNRLHAIMLELVDGFDHC